jgi:hypothetical protein
MEVTMENPPAAEFNGLYCPSGAQAWLDDKAALNLGYGYDPHLPGPHGTYTRIPFFWVRTQTVALSGQNVDNALLLIWDHNGDYCKFIWNGQDAWVSDPSAFSFPCAPNTTFPGNAIALTRPPTLILDVYKVIDEFNNSDAPSGSKAGELYIHSYQPNTPTVPGNRGRRYIAADPRRNPVADQKIRFDTYTKRFSWFTDQYPHGLEFAYAGAQPHEDCKDGKGCFGDVFQVQNHGYSQLAFPFCGFKPDELMTSGPQWTGIASPGTGNMYDDGDKKGGAKQDYGGTLIFNFPARDSKDYVASINVDGVPYFPLGFRARANPHSFGETLSQLVSTSQEEMNSWKVGLGLSGGIEKVFNVGLSGSYQNSKNICRESTSRYAVTRKGGVVWSAITDPPNLSLHQGFIEEVKSRLASWVKQDPHARDGMDLNWEGFVTRFGTHYLHAMTHGWLEISTQVFSLQAESVAQGWNLQLTAKGLVDGLTGKSQASLEESYNQKFGTKAESDTVKYSQLGDEKNPVAIFLDLRLLSELFSPVFFRYNPADDFGMLAPVVWYELRTSLTKHLEAFPTPALVNYSPRMFTLRILSITLIGKAHVKLVSEVFATGQVYVSISPGQGLVLGGTMEVSSQRVTKISMDGTGFQPDESFAPTIMVSPSVSGPFELNIEISFSYKGAPQGPLGSAVFYPDHISYTATFSGAGSTTIDDGHLRIGLELVAQKEA